MNEPAPTVFTSTKWTVTLSTLGIAMLVLYRIGVHAKSVADITWFLKLVVVQIVIYLGTAWLSLRPGGWSHLRSTLPLEHNLLPALLI
jgi:hypothetical protein